MMAAAAWFLESTSSRQRAAPEVAIGEPAPLPALEIPTCLTCLDHMLAVAVLVSVAPEETGHHQLLNSENEGDQQ